MLFLFRKIFSALHCVTNDVVFQTLKKQRKLGHFYLDN